MKKCIVFVLAVISLICLVGCNNRSMNYIIENEPNISGVVEAVYDKYIIIYVETDGYPNGAECKVSLDVENEESMTHFSVGDEVVVYYDGMIAESAPLQINTVYAITLKSHAERSQNDNIIDKKAESGWRYVGCIPTKQLGTGYVHEIDLIFEKEV